MLFLLDKPVDLINQIKKAGMKVNNLLVDLLQNSCIFALNQS